MILRKIASIFKRKKREGYEKLDNNDEFDHFLETIEPKPKEEREFDLVLFGATGYTGGFAAEYLARNYGVKISWAIAGRSQKKLATVK